MKRFDYVRPQTCAAASGEMENGAVYMAGGSDLLGELKQDILPKYPKKVVSLRDIPELKGVAVEDGKLKVGAMTTLTELTDQFNAENEYGIQVTLVNQGSYNDLSTKLTANAGN